MSDLLTMVPVESDQGLEIPPDQTKLLLAEMLSVGKSTQEIADNLDKSTGWVRKWKKDPGVVSLVNELHMEAVASAKATIVSHTSKAASTIVELMDTGPATVRLAAAKDLLDRVGMKAPDRKQIEQNVTVQEGMSKEARLARILERANRLGLEVPAHLRSQITDAEVIPVE